jgi:D-3-phosphoglycerate dehydrogenase
MKLNKYFVIDFDSTFTKVEAFDVLADISLNGHPEKEERKKQIIAITNQGMDGSISFRESLERRLNLLAPGKQHLPLLIKELKGSVSESFKRNKDFFLKYADHIFIISNGFKEFIEPIVTEFGIKSENILANEFRFDDDGRVIGFDEKWSSLKNSTFLAISMLSATVIRITRSSNRVLPISSLRLQKMLNVKM